MTEICEAIMLACFGLSWPISLYKNIKQKSAKGMNIYFTLLIIIGYIAGITAKIINGQFNYVFAIYILNLVVVMGNVVVFFVNKNLDKKRELEENQGKEIVADEQKDEYKSSKHGCGIHHKNLVKGN